MPLDQGQQNPYAPGGQPAGQFPPQAQGLRPGVQTPIPMSAGGAGGNPYAPPQQGQMQQSYNPYSQNPGAGQMLQQGAYGRQGQAPQFSFGNPNATPKGFSQVPKTNAASQFESGLGKYGPYQRGTAIAAGSPKQQEIMASIQAAKDAGTFHPAPGRGTMQTATPIKSVAARGAGRF